MNEGQNIKSEINIENAIKSVYILKGIFSFLSEKQKLNMIIYNKKLQKLLPVDIEDYKKISGKYKIAKKNGKGGEFILYTNKLIFEGQYSNGKRNGKGKEYNSDGKLIFEGEYLNGERNGKGKEYDYNGKLEFEGEYLNGERHRKEYHDNYIDYANKEKVKEEEVEEKEIAKIMKKNGDT